MKTGLKPLIFGIVLFVTGAFVIPLAIALPLFLSDSTEIQFLVPGSSEFNADAAGRYYLWNDHQTTFQGTTYSRPVSLPDGLQISIRKSSGEALEFVSDQSISWSVGSATKQSIGYVEVKQPSVITVNISGDAITRVFSFSRAKFLEAFGLIFGGVGLSIVLAMAGVVVVVIGIAKLAQGTKKE